MKKYSKTFAAMLVVLGVSATGVSAKEIPLNEVAKKVTEFNAAKERSNNSIFIVGNHVLTNYKALTAQNIYFAASHSIVNFDKPEDVYVYALEYKPNPDFESGTWAVTPVTVVGEHEYKADDKFDIQYIDFEAVETRDEMSTDDYIESIVGKIKKDDVNYKISLDKDSDTITALYYSDVESASFETIFDAEFVEKLYEILSKDIYGTTITLAPITEGSSTQPLSITLNDLTADDSLVLDEDKVATLVEKLSTFGDALKNDNGGKALNAQFKVSVSYDEENYANTDRKENGEEPTYTVTIKQQVNVKDYFKETGLDFIVKGNVATYNIQNTSASKWIQAQTEIKKIAMIFENAFGDKTASIKFTFGESNETYTLGTAESDIESYIAQYLATNGIESYEDLEDITISVTFKLLDGAVSENGHDTETFTIKLDSYINTDVLMDKVVTDFNKGAKAGGYTAYTAERKGSEIIITLNSVNNTLGDLGAANRNLAAKLKGALVAAKIQSVEINGKVVNNNNYEELIRTVMLEGTEKTTASELTVGELAKVKEIPIVLTIASGKKSQNQATTENYTLKFVVEDISVDAMLDGITDASESYFTSTYDAEKKELTIDLKNIDTLVKDVSGTGIIARLAQYVDLIKTISVNGTDLTASEDIKGKLIEILSAGKEDATLEDLTKEPLTLSITLIDDVNPSKSDKTTEVKVIFTSEAIKTATDEEGSTLEDLIKTGVEKIYLDKDQEVTDLQTLDDANDLVIIGNGHTIKGNVTVNSQSKVVTLQDLTIDGNLNLWNEAVIDNVKVTGKVTTDRAGEKLNKITIENGLEVRTGGNDIVISDSTISGEVSLAGNNAKVTDTDITGHVQVSGANVNISGGSIAGVRSEEHKNDNFAVVEVTGDGFTLDGATVSFDTAETTKYAYSLVRTNKVDGIKSTIQGNTFNIANVKNPIELFGETKDGTIITKNKFIGNNAEINLTDESTSKARNIISIYGVHENKAKISITNNEFEYANWAVRITNNDKEVLYNINNNTVEKQTVDEYVAFVGIEKHSGNGNLNLITIVAPNSTGANTIAGKNFVDMDGKRSTKDSSLTTRLVYVYDDTADGTSPSVVND